MPIKITRTSPPYFIGEVRALAPSDEAALVSTGIAEYLPGEVDITSSEGGDKSATLQTDLLTGDINFIGPDGEIISPVQIPREIFRTVNNVVETVSCPHPSRIIDPGGVRLFAFNQATPAPNANATVALGADYINRMPTGQVLTCSTAGSISATYTGLNITAGSYDPAKNYVMTLFNGSAGGNSGFSLSLTGAGGKSQAWSISGTGLRPGWNTIFLCSPTNTVAQGAGTPAGYGSQPGVVQVGASGGGGLAGTTITGIQVTFFNQAVGDFMVLDSIETATRVKPAVVFTFDQSPTDPGNLMASVIPMFQARGLVGSCRYHSLNDKAAPANCRQALAAGWDIVNGTLTRQTPVTTVAAVLKEYGQNQNEMSALGLGKSYWANPPGNNTNSDTELCKTAFRQLGIKYSKGVSHNVVYSGVQGLSNPYSLGTVSLNTVAQTVAQSTSYMDSAVAAGAHLIYFQHTNPAELDLVKLGQILDYAAALKAAGLIDDVTLTGLKDVLEGNA